MSDWCKQNPFLTFFLAWIFVGYLTQIIVRAFRVIKVVTKGWPPAHLDADGDWKPNDKD